MSQSLICYFLLEDLAGRGAKIVLAVRDVAAAEDVVAEIKQRYSYADLVMIIIDNKLFFTSCTIF